MASKICANCDVDKPIDEFRLRVKDSRGGKKDEPNAICARCCDQRAAARKARDLKRKAEAEAEESGGPGKKKPGDGKIATDLGEMDAAQFLEALKGMDSPLKLRARVNAKAIAPVGPSTSLQRADLLAKAIGQVQLLRWSREAKKGRLLTDHTAVSYSCAQSKEREHKPKVPRGKSRDTRRKPRFFCDGWLHLRVSPSSEVVDVAITHAMDHVAYRDTELPERWKGYIRLHARSQTPSEIWKYIVQEEMRGRTAKQGGLPFRPKAVYYYWNVASREEWKLAADPIESARKFIAANGEKEHIALLEVEAEPGTECLAFYVTDFVDAWAEHTQELAMDSTWNTNGGNFELFSAVADANGSGIPLAFLFIRTTKEAASGAKQAVLERFLQELKSLGVDPEFTLTDKDWSEINAMGSVFPDAKHQLCFWHGIRALKQRLCKNKETPAHYDAGAAHRDFSFIDPDFVPAAQRPPGALPTNTPPAKPLPRVRLLVDGRPPVITPALPRIRLTPETIARALGDSRGEEDTTLTTDDFDLRSANAGQANPSDVSGVGLDTDLDRLEEGSDDGTYWAGQERQGEALDDEWDSFLEGAEWADDEDDIRREVEIIGRDKSNIKTNAPTPASERGPPASSHDYQFCPPAHRVPVLRLFTKHACQHSLLPERHGEARSANDIYRDAVDEMYRHCKSNNLAEVWAYLWNAWYCESRWKLWARSAYEDAVPRKRTTMIVESLWRGIKRLVLHLYNRPPLDLALYSIVTKAIPRYRITLGDIITNINESQSATLSYTQESMKRAWERLEKVPIRGTYTTDVRKWTCDCGTQKYHAHLLCKHLVQAVGHPSADWWPTATRYHIPPFYTVPLGDDTPADPPESMRSHDWTKRMRQTRSAIVPRRRRLQTPDPADGSDVDIPGVGDGCRSSSPISSSPEKAPPTGRDGIFRFGAGGGAGHDLDDEEEVKLDQIEQSLLDAAVILREQVDNPDGRFLRTASERMRGMLRWVADLDGEAHPPDPASITSGELCARLARAHELFRELRNNSGADSEGIMKAKQRLRDTGIWVRALELAENRRTMPLTNSRGRGTADPRITYGYRYHDRAA